jgi:hypothetical protein
MRRNAIILVPAAIVALFAIFALVSRSGGPGSGCGSFHFDRAAWQRGSLAPQTGQLSPRWRTADKLAQCGTLDDHTRSEVAGLLGAATTRSKLRWLYPVGYELGDLRYLEVRFGADGRVRGATGPS